MDKPFVSIIVPMYNVEKYLPKCVESITNQTLENIEIILVDDESPDKSGEMADGYAKEDSRIKVIHQKNKWLGGARNSGIKIATGEYLMFVDSDDYLELNACEELYDFAENNKCDLVLFNMANVDGDYKTVSVSSDKSVFKENQVLNKEQIKTNIYPILISSHILNHAGMKFTHRSIFENGFRFDEKIRYAEDYESSLRLYPMAQRIGYIDKPFYNYLVSNDTSIMHVIKFERIAQLTYLYDLREQFIKDENMATKENLFNSAHLVIKLVIEKFPSIFGIFGKSYSQKTKELKEMFKNKSLYEAADRIKIKELEMGLFGKLCFAGLKAKIPFIIILASKIYYGRTEKTNKI